MYCKGSNMLFQYLILDRNVTYDSINNMSHMGVRDFIVSWKRKSWTDTSYFYY